MSSLINFKKIFLGVILFISYSLVVRILKTEEYFFFLFLTLTGFFLTIGVFNFIGVSLKNDIATGKLSLYEVKDRFVLFFLFLVSVFLINKIGGLSEWLVKLTIDQATFMVILYLPLIWLLKISSFTNGLLAILFLMFTAFFSVNKFEETTENLAIVIFWLMTIAVVQQIYDQKNIS